MQSPSPLVPDLRQGPRRRASIGGHCGVDLPGTRLWGRRTENRNPLVTVWPPAGGSRPLPKLLVL